MCESIDIFTSDSPPPLPRPQEPCSCGRGFFVPILMGDSFSGGVAPFLAVVYVAYL